MRWLVFGAVCLAACRPFDEALDASIVRLSMVDGGGTDGGADAGLDAGGLDAGGVDAGLDGGDLDAGPDAGLDAGTDDAGLDAGTDAGIDAGPRCIVQKRVAFPNSFTAPAPSAAIAVATVDAAWLVAMVESTGGFQIAKYDGSMVGVPLPIGCGGNCVGVHVSRAGAEPRWFAAGWSPTGAQRWSLAAGGVPNQAMAFGASCINPGNLIGADVVGGADGGSMAVGCDTGFSVNLPSLLPQYGDSAGREVRVARNEAGEGRIAWTSDAGCQVALLDVVTGLGATLVRTGIPELRAIAVDVSPAGDAWLAGLNAVGGVSLYRFDPTGDGGRVNPLALDAVATVSAPVGLAADERGAVVAFSRNNTVYAQPVFADGGYDRTVIVTTDGINPQIAWRRSYGPGAPDLYVVTWIAPSSYMPMLAELSCAPEP